MAVEFLGFGPMDRRPRYLKLQDTVRVDLAPISAHHPYTEHGLVRIEGNRRTSRGRMAAVHFIPGGTGDEEAREEGGEGELETTEVK